MILALVQLSEQIIKFSYLWKNSFKCIADQILKELSHPSHQLKVRSPKRQRRKDLQSWCTRSGIRHHYFGALEKDYFGAHISAPGLSRVQFTNPIQSRFNSLILRNSAVTCCIFQPAFGCWALQESKRWLKNAFSMFFLCKKAEKFKKKQQN